MGSVRGHLALSSAGKSRLTISCLTIYFKQQKRPRLPPYADIFIVLTTLCHLLLTDPLMLPKGATKGNEAPPPPLDRSKFEKKVLIFSQFCVYKSIEMLLQPIIPSKLSNFFEF